AVTGSPLWKRGPLRSVKSYTSPSGEALHASARLGAEAWPGIGFTSASCSAYMSMYGVIRPGVSAGSNQVGASVMCTAQVSWPSAAAAGEGASAAATSRRREAASGRRTRWLMCHLVMRRVGATMQGGASGAGSYPHEDVGGDVEIVALLGDLGHPGGELRMVPQDAREARLVQRHQIAAALGADGGGARGVDQQGELAEHVAV